MEKNITILSAVRKQDEENAKKIFDRIVKDHCKTDLNKVLKIGDPGQVQGQLLFALNISRDTAVPVIKELVFEGFTVLKNEPFIKTTVKEAAYELQFQKATTVQRVKEEERLKQKSKKLSDYTIEDLVFLNDWQLMLEVMMKQSHENIDKSRRIKEILPDVLRDVIENEIERSDKGLDFARECIDKLEPIAGNETLKRLHFMGIMHRAGEAIINISLKHPESLIEELIFLINSNSTAPQTNIKAFMTFFEVVNKNTEKYKEAIDTGARYINTRALDKVYLASVRLDADKLNAFNKGITFFKEQRDLIASHQ